MEGGFGVRPTNALIIFLFCILLVLTPVVIIRKCQRPRETPLSLIPITLLSRHEGKIYHTDLERYLVGVVAAEMPANFALSALKAQAIAARTIAVGRLKRFGGRGCQHYAWADLCDDPSENQAWQSIDDLKSKWGSSFQNYYERVNQAVRETAGIIMTYHNRPIDAVFHSTCGVGTADAVEVWQHSTPYLRSVDCGYDQQSPRYSSQVELSWTQLAVSLHLPLTSLNPIRIRQRSNRGRVLQISVGKYLFRGEHFRRALTLNSTCFTCTASKKGVIFKVTGYGHGVGMCQYGANGMAKMGCNYQQILCHYYQGIHFCMIK
jgi:stage II sporulation protein D